MRRAVSLVVALGLIGAGLYLVIVPLYEGWLSPLMLAAGGFLAAIGAAWFWADYLSPMRNRRKDAAGS